MLFVLLLIVLFPTNNRNVTATTSNISRNAKVSPGIDTCLYVKSGADSQKNYRSFVKFDELQEFMSTTRVVLRRFEIHDQPMLTKLHKYALSPLNYVEEIVIRNCGLAEIDPGTFHASDSFLDAVRLTDNRLEMILQGVFTGLRVQYLDLSRNRIKAIDPDALNNMHRLERVNLIGNRLTAYDWRWFDRSPLLETLYFQNNTIRAIPERAFRHLIDRPRDLNIFFSFNEIRFIHPAAFDGGIILLHLDHNVLVTWTEALSKYVTELDISYNHIERIEGNLSATIKNNSLARFVGNPFECYCLKEIKTIGDRRGEREPWFLQEYLKCRRKKHPRTSLAGDVVEVFSAL